MEIVIQGARLDVNDFMKQAKGVGAQILQQLLPALC